MNPRTARRGLFFTLLAAVGALVLFLALAAPAPGDLMLRPDDISLDPLRKVPAAAWQSLARQRWFFGHQSVGEDILVGIEAIQRELDLPRWPVIHGSSGATPGLYEAKVGVNTDPEAKIRAFAATLRGAAPTFDVALMKLCYVDVVATTNVRTLFDHYRTAMAQLERELPGVRLLHCTVPLTATRMQWKSRLKRWLGKVPADDADNLARQAYNDLLRAEYGGRGRLVDLAAAESTLPDGSAVRWQIGGLRFACLAAGYTSDGGHLNDVGQRAVASAVLLRWAEVAAAR